MDLESYVKKILEDIRLDGSDALKRYSKKFDGYSEEFKVSMSEFEITDSLDKEDKKMIDRIIERVRKVHEEQTDGDKLRYKNDSLFGLIEVPIERIGIYVPGGKPLPSTLIMAGVPAMIAGVDDIVVTTPPTDGMIDPYILYIADKLGIEEVYKLGGVQAIGAMTYGVGMEKVDKIFGPGNKYVNEAKRQVYGDVGIDGLAGPSEIAIVADEDAEKEYVLEDLRSQLEHDEDAKAWLLTTSRTLAESVKDERVNVKIFSDRIECIQESNRIAPEHLEILTKDPRSLLKYVRNAGAVYLGDYTPAAAADYFLGVNHILPTGGASKFESVLTVDDFVKKISVAESGRVDYMNDRELGIRLASIEDMECHKKAMEVRR
ncbi:MAG: histidinol dehydrogenase [Candidatus Natronoplasma sp.]